VKIRLQWWRDALQPGDAATRTGNPVADALREATSGTTCRRRSCSA
jgi:hypothetical protein